MESHHDRFYVDGALVKVTWAREVRSSGGGPRNADDPDAPYDSRRGERHATPPRGPQCASLAHSSTVPPPRPR